MRDQDTKNRASARNCRDEGGTAEGKSDSYWMRQALRLAEQAAACGEVPIGAVVVKDGEQVSGAHNQREAWHDPTAHAELIAIREASRTQRTWRLQGCTLYVTLEPCPMCAGAIILSRLERIVYGAKDPKGGAVISKMQLLQPGIWNHQPMIEGGILSDECGMILKDFFRQLR